MTETLAPVSTMKLNELSIPSSLTSPLKKPLDVSLSGSGDAQLGELSARSVHAVVGGSGRIVTTATDTLDAAVPGSGAVVYGGAPTHVTSNVTGSGAVIPG